MRIINIIVVVAKRRLFDEMVACSAAAPRMFRNAYTENSREFQKRNDRRTVTPSETFLNTEILFLYGLICVRLPHLWCRGLGAAV